MNVLSIDWLIEFCHSWIDWLLDFLYCWRIVFSDTLSFFPLVDWLILKERPSTVNCFQENKYNKTRSINGHDISGFPPEPEEAKHRMVAFSVYFFLTVYFFSFRNSHRAAHGSWLKYVRNGSGYAGLGDGRGEARQSTQVWVRFTIKRPPLWAAKLSVALCTGLMHACMHICAVNSKGRNKNTFSPCTALGLLSRRDDFSFLSLLSFPSSSPDSTQSFLRRVGPSKRGNFSSLNLPLRCVHLFPLRELPPPHSARLQLTAVIKIIIMPSHAKLLIVVIVRREKSWLNNKHNGTFLLCFSPGSFTTL